MATVCWRSDRSRALPDSRTLTGRTRSHRLVERFRSLPLTCEFPQDLPAKVPGDRGSNATLPIMSELLVGYARCSTDSQDLTAQIDGPPRSRPAAGYVDHGLTGTTRARPGLREALTMVRAGDTLVVTKLDRLARSVPDARAIADELTARTAVIHGVVLVAEFEADLARLRTREGMAIAKAKGRLRGKRPKLSPSQEAHLVELHREGGTPPPNSPSCSPSLAPPSTEPSTAPEPTRVSAGQANPLEISPGLRRGPNPPTRCIPALPRHIWANPATVWGRPSPSPTR